MPASNALLGRRFEAYGAEVVRRNGSEIDISAGVIRLFEKLGWATDVRWPSPERLAKLTREPVPGSP